MWAGRRDGVGKGDGWREVRVDTGSNQQSLQAPAHSRGVGMEVMDANTSIPGHASSELNIVLGDSHSSNTPLNSTDWMPGMEPDASHVSLCLMV